MTTQGLHARVEGDDLVVELVGDIDYQVGRALYDDLYALLESAGHRRFVIDLARVPFLDSSGLRALLRANAGDRTVALRGVGPALFRVIDLVAPGQFTIIE
jgi:stage II sporulation protein AA (anti-sigma F factor antagonist)